MSSLLELQYHLVWVTKYRYRLLDSFMAEEIKRYILGKQEMLHFKVISIAVEPDHVHLLVQGLKGFDLEKTVQRLKGGSSFLLRKKFPKLNSYTSLWTPSHFAGSVGNVSNATVENYLQNQGIEEKETVNRTFVYKILPSKRKREILERYLVGKNKEDKTLAPAFMVQNAKRVSEDSLPLRNDVITLEHRDRKRSKLWLKIPGGKTCNTKAFWIGLVGRELPENVRIKDSFVKLVNHKVKVYLIFEKEQTFGQFPINHVLALDLGVNHIATSVTLLNGKVKKAEFWGKTYRNLNWKAEQRRSKLQKLGAEKKWSNLDLPKCMAKYNNRKRDCLHQFTASIVKKAREERLGIVVGNIRGIRGHCWRKGRVRKRQSKRMNTTPYGTIMSQLAYKAIRQGVPLVFVDEAYSSQRCFRCEEVKKSNRKGGKYICSCGYHTQADLNGASNLGTWSLKRLLPELSLACLLRSNDTPRSLVEQCKTFKTSRKGDL